MSKIKGLLPSYVVAITGYNIAPLKAGGAQGVAMRTCNERVRSGGSLKASSGERPIRRT
jgi:hypothetical protein